VLYVGAEVEQQQQTTAAADEALSFVCSLSLVGPHTRARSRSWRCQLTELKLLHYCGDNNNNTTTLEGRACRWFYLSLCLYRVSIARDSASTQAASHRARRSHTHSHSLNPTYSRSQPSVLFLLLVGHHG